MTDRPALFCAHADTDGEGSRCSCNEGHQMTVHDNAAGSHKYRLMQAEQIIREVMGADVYTSAGYIAEPHPDDPEHQPLCVDLSR